MFIVSVRAFAETASFRLPETHTFHKTLPLPPHTTCIGLLGAALGRRMEEAQGYVDSNAIRIGVAGRDEGGFRDLWKYHKVKAAKVIPDVLIREYRAGLSLLLAYGTEDRGLAEGVAAAFLDPVYALTAGHSDSLLLVKSVRTSEAEPEPLSKIQFCVVPGDLASRYEPDRSIFDRPITEATRAPVVAHLPVRFVFDGQRRTVAAREAFTFVGHPIQLVRPVEGFRIGEDTLVLR